MDCRVAWSIFIANHNLTQWVIAFTHTHPPLYHQIKLCFYLNRKMFHDLKTNKLAVRRCPHSAVSSQNNASKLLLAIMESRHDSENAERILYNMRPKELVRTRPPLAAIAHHTQGCRQSVSSAGGGDQKSLHAGWDRGGAADGGRRRRGGALHIPAQCRPQHLHLGASGQRYSRWCAQSWQINFLSEKHFYSLQLSS